uniref:Hypoxanthine-guanine phosphoribosyltransferase n=1 Tax=uncultured bacterium contig00160 TaxID=1181593 RepID=A0A806K217_9BACT|nr:hypoxanthine-guanine phosphoribosyltransferase [uncultured bacterium contig00160]
MKKEFLQFDIVRDNALKLAHRIYTEGFIPDVIYVSLRGGAYLGNVISEYFKIVHKGTSPSETTRPVYYAAVVARSYTDVAHAEKVKVDGWTYSPEHLRVGDKVLLIDDIFDSGRTINHLAQIIIDKGIPRNDLKIAVHDYKFFHDKSEQLAIQPDYWCRKHEMSINDENTWIHYMSHELVGLKRNEIEEHYYSRDPDLQKVMDIII